MALFGLGNIFLKIKRAGLPRPKVAPLPLVLIAIAAVTAGLIGNAIMNPSYLSVFLEYFIPTMFVVIIMLSRITILQACLFIVQSILRFFIRNMTFISQLIRDKIGQINAQQIVFFTRGDNLANLNKVMLYVQQNEHTDNVKVATVVKSKNDVSANLSSDLELLNQMYPSIKIEFVVIVGLFEPKLIQELSEKWSIPRN